MAKTILMSWTTHHAVIADTVTTMATTKTPHVNDDVVDDAAVVVDDHAPTPTAAQIMMIKIVMTTVADPMASHAR